MSESGERSPEEATTDSRRVVEDRYSPRHLIEQQLRTVKYFTVECRTLIERLVGDTLLPQTQATGLCSNVDSALWFYVYCTKFT